MDDWLSVSSYDGRWPIGRRIAGDLSALASNGNWSIAGSLATWAIALNGNWSVAGSLATWALWRRTATDRRLVGVKLLRVERVLLLRPVATSCRSTQVDMSVLASTYVWSRPTWARSRVIATCCSKAAIDLRFDRSEHSCVAVADSCGGTQSTCGYLVAVWRLRRAKRRTLHGRPSYDKDFIL